MPFSNIRDIFHMTFEEAVDKPIYLYAVGLLVLLIAALWIVRSLKRELIPVFSDEEGLVQITPHALHELVRRTCEAFSRNQLPVHPHKKGWPRTEVGYSPQGQARLQRQRHPYPTQGAIGRSHDSKLEFFKLRWR